MTTRLEEDSVSEAWSESGDRHVVPSVLLVPSSPVPCTRLLFLCLHADFQFCAFGRGAGKFFDKICTKRADKMREDLFYDAIKKEVEENVYTQCFVSPAVNTFTSDLRGNVAPDIYGWTPMPSNLKDVVRYETLLVLRAAEILDIFSKLNLPWIIENPFASEPDLFALPEFVKLLNSHSDVLCTKFEHCPDARHTTGVTRILGRVGSFTRSQNYFSSWPGKIAPKVANIGQTLLLEHFAQKLLEHLPYSETVTIHHKVVDVPVAQVHRNLWRRQSNSTVCRSWRKDC